MLEIKSDRSEFDIAVSALFAAGETLGRTRVLVCELFGPARKAAGITQREIAEEAKVSVPYVSDIERGRRDPPMHVCEALLRLITAKEVPDAR